MTTPNRARSAAGVVVAAGTEPRGPRVRLAMARRLSLSLVTGLLMATGAGGLALPASANNGPARSMSMSAPSTGRMTSGTAMGSLHTRSIVSLHRPHFSSDDFGARKDFFERARTFRRFHHRDRGRFANAFFPFGFFSGFSWPFVEPELAAAAADQGDQADWPNVPFWLRADRYEPPTVEKAPSGVTIIRGPGSHHGFLSYP